MNSTGAGTVVQIPARIPSALESIPESGFRGLIDRQVLVGQALLPVRLCASETFQDRQSLAGARDKECLSYSPPPNESS